MKATALSFQNGVVYLNGQTIFTVPVKRATMNTVTVLGYNEFDGELGDQLLVGTGTCCHGHLYKLQKSEGEYPLSQVIAVDTNVMDILPVSVDYKKTGFANESAVLVVGYGCAGAGVRLLGTSYPRMIDVITSEQLMANIPNGQHAAPIFRADKNSGTIHLDIRRAGFQQKPGTKREAGLPSILVDKNEEFRVSVDVWTSMNITKRLEEVGVDIGKTIELVSTYRRINAR